MKIIKNNQCLFYNYKMILLYKNGVTSLYDREKNKLIGKIDLRLSRKLLSRLRFISRLLRLFPKNCIYISDFKYVLSIDKKIILVDFKNKKTKIIYKDSLGNSTPLNIIKSVEDKYLFFFGDYSCSDQLTSVKIYGVNKSYEVNTLYVFPNNSIRHIHNIIFCEKINKYIILTGDNQVSSGLYISNLDFSNVQEFLVGQDNYRSAIGMCIDECFIYPSDYPDRQNYLYILDLNDKKIISKQEIKGSSIYGCNFNGVFVFSTCVEPLEKCNKIIKCFINKRGKGIIDNYSRIMYLDKNKTVCELFKAKKDKYNMRLFGFGTFTFPDHHNDVNQLIVNGIGLKKYDNTVIIFEEKDLKLLFKE